jgi:peptidylprolyl isomerase
MVRAALPAVLLTAAVPALADDDVIANLGTQAVKASELKEMLPPLNPAQREQAARDPKFVAQIVRGAIGRKVVLDEALKQSWDKKPDIAAQIERARSEIIVSSFLQSASLPSPNYPSEDEIRQTYEANKGKFAIQPEYHLAQIYLAVPPDAKKEMAAAAEQKAQELGKKAKAKPTDFAELARANSEDKVSAPRGGDLGWLPESQLVPEIAAAVKKVKGHGVTEPINAAGGWHIVEVLGTVPGQSDPPLDQVHDLIVKLLRDGKANEYVQKLLDDKRLTVNETAAVKLFSVKQ